MIFLGAIFFFFCVCLSVLFVVYYIVRVVYYV